ncbi:MAG: ABC transporter substrate-binding protein [Candidatus Bathyarchaeia archaeon]
MILAGIIFILAFTSLTIAVQPVKAEQRALFSCTLTASTGNPVRRQHAALIANAMQSVGIDAKLIYIIWSDLVNRMFGENYGTFEQGGIDLSFIGFYYTSPVPDIRSNYASDSFPPTGNNYYHYNSSEADDLLNRIYTTGDTAVQQQLFRQLSKVIDRDKPVLIIYQPSSVLARSKDIKMLGDEDVFSSMTTPQRDLHLVSGVKTYAMAASNGFSSLAPWATSDSNTAYALYAGGGGAYIVSGGLQNVDPRTDTFYKTEALDITASDDGLNWTVTIRPGIKFHDGVEATAEDYMFYEWAILQPEVASVSLPDYISRLGNLVYFTWLNGTTTAVNNTAPGEEIRVGEFKALDRYRYTFTVPSPPYPFINLTHTTDMALPKHYLEQIPTSEWNTLPFATGLGGAYTFTWDTSKYGGNGSYTAYGPFGTGPYVYMGFDATTQTAKLVKFKDYWDRAALEAQGYFSVEEYYVTVILEKDAAMAAYKTGEVNVLDTQYMLTKADQEALAGMGANIIIRSGGPGEGWQELGINMLHPVLGTGRDTPLGRSDPSKAAEAARHVRQAISYLIPRQLVVDRLLDGLGTPGFSAMNSFGPLYVDPSLKPDPYDPQLARAELAAAGYATGVGPITETVTTTATYILVGSTPVALTGKFVNPVTGQPASGFLVYMQESFDNATWRTFGAVVTDEEGAFNVTVIPERPVTYYRANFTGYTAPLPAFNPVALIQDWGAYDQLVREGRLPLVLPPEAGPTIKVTAQTIDEVLSDFLKNVASKSDLASATANLATKGDVSTLTSRVASLESSLSSMTMIAYGSIAVAIISLIVAVVAVSRKRGA